jgi:hypothetical protein
MILVPRCYAELDSDAGNDIIRTHEVSFACIVCFDLSSEIIPDPGPPVPAKERPME